MRIYEYVLLMILFYYFVYILHFCLPITVVFCATKNIYLFLRFDENNKFVIVILLEVSSDKVVKNMTYAVVVLCNYSTTVLLIRLIRWQKNLIIVDEELFCLRYVYVFVEIKTYVIFSVNYTKLLLYTKKIVVNLVFYVVSRRPTCFVASVFIFDCVRIHVTLATKNIKRGFEFWKIYSVCIFILLLLYDDTVNGVQFYKNQCIIVFYRGIDWKFLKINIVYVRFYFTFIT